MSLDVGGTETEGGSETETETEGGTETETEGGTETETEGGTETETEGGSETEGRYRDRATVPRLRWGRCGAQAVVHVKSPTTQGT